MNEKEELNFACFERTSQGGKRYFNGEVKIGERGYWISIFENVSKKGDKYLSGILREKAVQKEMPKQTTVQSNDDWIDDEIF